MDDQKEQAWWRRLATVKEMRWILAYLGIVVFGELVRMYQNETSLTAFAARVGLSLVAIFVILVIRSLLPTRPTDTPGKLVDWYTSPLLWVALPVLGLSLAIVFFF